MDKPKKLKMTMKVSNSFKIYITHVINGDFREGDLERGYTKVFSKTIGDAVYYKRPPKDMVVMAVVKKRDMKFLKDKYKEILPDLIYFV